MAFNYVSLFSGVGGFEQALNKLGGVCVMASEIDKYANKSYEILYGHRTVGDVTKVPAEEVPDHDMLVAGFPCPTFSVAGGRDGMEYQCNDCGHEHLITFEDYKNGAKCPLCTGETTPKDERGLLFFEVARVAEESKPKVLLLENVKGLISSAKGEVLRVIMETLNGIGYTVDFNVLNSKHFGVPQNRERIFIIAVKDGLVNQQPWLIEGANVVARGKRRIIGAKTFNFDWPEQKECTTKLREILEENVDSSYFLDKEKISKFISSLRDRENYFKTMGNEDVMPVLTPEITNKNCNGQRVKPNDEPMYTLTQRDRNGVAVREATKLGYAIAEPGDAINVQFPESKTRRGRVGRQIAQTLETSCNQATLLDDLRIRKLTPRECFRLQGFPDSEFDKLVEGGISNSQLYKQAGNAVTVNVISAIGKRLLPLLG